MSRVAQTGPGWAFEIKHDGFRFIGAACRMKLEGIVAKRRDRRYHSGRSRDWINKVKNMAHPAIERAMLIALSKRVVRAAGEPTVT